MVKYIEALPLIADSQLHDLSIIAQCKLIRFFGSLSLKKIENQFIDADRNLNFDYLVHINQSNNLVHPDDMDDLKRLLGEAQAGKMCKIKFRIITPAGSLWSIDGLGNLQTAEQIFGEGDKGPTDIKNGWVENRRVIPQIKNRKALNNLEEIISHKNPIKAVFNTFTPGLHVLESVRNERGEIIDFDLLTNENSDRIAGKKVHGSRMLERWPHMRDIGLFDKFVQAVETGQPIDYEHDYNGDGVTTCLKWIAYRLNDGLYVTVEDISEHKGGDKILHQNADRLHSLFNGIPGIIALLEVVGNSKQKPLDFVISCANKAMADFSGIKVADLVGKKMSDLHPEALRPQLQDGFQQVFNTGEPLFLELFYPEMKKWFAVYVTKQINEIGLITAFLDITEQKAGEEHRKKNHLLSELNQAKTEFFNNVSHEFRTPLTLMLGPLNDVLKRVCEKPINHEDIQKLQMVQRNALRLQKMVNTLMDFSRMEAGREDGIFQPTDLAEFTTQLAGNFRSVIEKAGLKLVVNCDATEYVYINHDMWEKIVFNLLSNAFKFTFEGKIEVSLVSYKRHVQLHIADTGIGISPSNMPQIFERFIRIPNARSRTYEGTGIGLSLVKDFVHLHGGKIKVKSKEGKGAVFIVCIPLGKDHLPAKNIYEMKGQRAENNLSSIYEKEALNWLPDETLAVPYSKIGLRLETNSYNGVTEDQKQLVLLVEDNADMRDYIKSILCTRYKVITAHNGRKALELLSANLRPDLVLADLMMPEMDGISLLNEMKGNEKTALIPVVILSARASEEDRIEGIRRGAEDYLVKPFSRLELIARVDCRIRNTTRQTEHAI